MAARGTGPHNACMKNASDSFSLADTGTGIRAFVVEDSAAIAERLIGLLTEGGDIRVVGQAGSAETAIEGILQLRPDVVTLDIHLRGSSGLRVIQEVRRLAPEIEFIVLTGHPDPFYRRAFTRAGARRFLDKNRDFGSVRQAVLSVCADARESTSYATQTRGASHEQCRGN